MAVRPRPRSFVGILLAAAFAATGSLAQDGAFIRAEGRQIVRGGEPVRLRGVNFSNYYHSGAEGAPPFEAVHHTDADFERVKKLGFNSIRFAFNGDWFAKYPDEFWTWLDGNIAEAKAHGIYLVLDLHVPIGSFWLDPTKTVKFGIWTDDNVRRHNIELWRSIAERYANEPQIAAYDILNEAVTVDSTGQQWRDLANDLVAAIRAVDSNHLIVVGGLYGVDGAYGGIEYIETHFIVDDPNVMYDFHFYEPVKYTHQFADWLEGPPQDGGRYPDPDMIFPTGQQVLLDDSRISTSSIVPGTSDWTRYESGLHAVTDERAVAALPMMTVRGEMKGKVFFDDLRIDEYNSHGHRIGTVKADRLTDDRIIAWSGWQNDEETPTRLGIERSEGHSDTMSLSIAGASGGIDMVAGWSNDDHIFRVKPGRLYRLSGYMRGDDIAFGEGATASLDLDILAGNPEAPGQGLFGRDKSYLEYEMMKHLAFGEKHNVPMSVMEFGLVRRTFEASGKGGARWVADVLDLLARHELSFAFWEYHGEPMGLYLNEKKPPPEGPNVPLIETLRRELAK